MKTSRVVGATRRMSSTVVHERGEKLVTEGGWGWRGAHLLGGKLKEKRILISDPEYDFRVEDERERERVLF